MSALTNEGALHCFGAKKNSISEREHIYNSNEVIVQGKFVI